MRSLRDNALEARAEIVISNNELEFQTSWIGALILGMPMGFLLLYLVFVYPISYVGG